MPPTAKMKQNVAIKLHTEDVQAVEDWRLLDQQIKKLTAERDAIINRFKIRMESTSAEVCQFRNTTLVKRSETHRTILDGKRLKAEKPEIAEEYSKTSDTWRPAYV